MAGNKAIKRALQTKTGADRLTYGAPPTTSSTWELVTADTAREMLKNNKNNRIIQWGKVHAYAEAMSKGLWKPTPEPVIIDKNGNLLNGQKRLCAIVESGISQWMKIDRGCEPELAFNIDRGTPQSARDLATRKTERKHSPAEQMIIRAYLAFNENTRPSPDDIAEAMAQKDDILNTIIKNTKGVKKTKPIYIILGAICCLSSDYNDNNLKYMLGLTDILASMLEEEYKPNGVSGYWNKGGLFSSVMRRAVSVVKHMINKEG